MQVNNTQINETPKTTTSSLQIHPVNLGQTTSARHPISSAQKQYSQEYERSSSLSELTKQRELEAAVGTSAPVDRDIAIKMSAASLKTSGGAGHTIYDRVAAALNMRENLPAHILGLGSDQRRHSAFASTTTATSSSDQVKSTSGSSQLSSGSSYTGSVGRQQNVVVPSTPSGSITTGTTTTVSRSHVSTHVRQRLKDCVLNKRRSKECAATGSGGTSLVSASMETDEDRSFTTMNSSLHRDSYATDSEFGFPTGYGFSSLMFAAGQMAAGRDSTTLTDTGAPMGNIPPWVVMALSAGRGDMPSNMESHLDASRNNSALLRKTMSEPSLKIRGTNGGLKHKSCRNERRNVNPLAVAAAVVNSAPYFAGHIHGARSMSEAGDVGQGLSLRKPISKLRSQQNTEGKDLTKHSEETEGSPMEVTTGTEGKDAVPESPSTDVEMNEFPKNPPEEDREAVQEFLSSLASSPGAMSGGLLKATQNYLKIVREYMKQERGKHNNRGGSPKTQLELQQQLMGVTEEKTKMVGGDRRGRQLSSASTSNQVPHRRCKQVSGLLSRTRSAPIRLTGNLARGAFGPSTSFEGALGGGSGGVLLSAASAIAMEAAAINSRSMGKATAASGAPEDEQRSKVMQQLRRKLLEK